LIYRVFSWYFCFALQKKRRNKTSEICQRVAITTLHIVNGSRLCSFNRIKRLKVNTFLEVLRMFFRFVFLLFSVVGTGLHSFLIEFIFSFLPRFNYYCLFKKDSMTEFQWLWMSFNKSGDLKKKDITEFVPSFSFPRPFFCAVVTGFYRVSVDGTGLQSF